MSGVQKQIVTVLREKFSVVYLDVINESHTHNVPENSETHFKIVLVSDDFTNKSLVMRHRQVQEFVNAKHFPTLHALSLKLFTVAEWQEQGGVVEESPPCLGGSKS